MSAPIEDLPCWHCKTPQGADVRHRIGQGGLDDGQRSPISGLIGCCRIRSVPLEQHPDPPPRSAVKAG
jgi:hypothetical protein